MAVSGIVVSNESYLQPVSRSGDHGCCKKWCPRGDSNPHALRRYHLKVVRLPIPPPGQRYPSLGSAPPHPCSGLLEKLTPKNVSLDPQCPPLAAGFGAGFAGAAGCVACGTSLFFCAGAAGLACAACAFCGGFV